MGITMTKKELANAAGYTYRRLYDIDRDLPEEEKLFVSGDDGKYDLAMFVQRWVEYNVRSAKGGDGSLDDAKREHEMVKMRKTELEVARMEGNLVDVQEVRRMWGDIAATVMQNMLRLPGKIAPLAAAEHSAAVIQGIIDREIREALEMIAETPVPEANAGTDGEGGAE